MRAVASVVDPAEWILVAIVALVILWFAWIEWPGLHSDATFFAPPVINVATGKGWSFGGYLPFFVLKGNDLYDFHGLLHILLYGVLLRCKTWESLSIWMGVVNAFTFLLYYALYRRCLRISEIGIPFLAVLFAIVPVVIAIGLQGRPEQLALPLMALPLLLHGRVQPYGAWLRASGAITGLVVLASPLLGAVYAAGLIIASWILDPQTVFQRLLHIAMALLILVLTVVLVIGAFTPYDALSWALRTVQTGSMAFDSRKFLFGFWAYRWGFTIIAPLWNLFTIFALGVSAWALARLRYFLPLVFGMIVIMLATPRMLDYGFLPFLPLALCGLCYRNAYISVADKWLPDQRFLLKLASIWSLLFAYVMVAWLVISIHPGVHFHSAATSRLALEQWLPRELREDGSVAVGYQGLHRPNPIVLLDPKIHAIDIRIRPEQRVQASRSEMAKLERYENATGAKVEYYLFQQKYPFLRADLPSVLSIGGRVFHLIDDNWTDSYSPIEKLVRPRDLPNDFRLALFRSVDAARPVRETGE
ncbi:hypothetical protein Cyagr_1253 [Cyanobium gracile PCC 6307]|uniref:Uncharacterized protein n=1 Tax=Cyanobium gracile (strain ATCC 27147 / PCC 6307) TaxID=292564 RepID=K9P6U1_CYAGP|nr:hypothetical protein Cyagr_1253 [Cyanobium gracile PCC 6307]